MNESDTPKPTMSAAPTDRSPEQPKNASPEAEAPVVQRASVPPAPDPFSFEEDGFDAMFAREGAQKASKDQKVPNDLENDLKDPKIPPPPPPGIEAPAEAAAVPDQSAPPAPEKTAESPTETVADNTAAGTANADRAPATWRSKSQPPPEERPKLSRRGVESRRRGPVTPPPVREPAVQTVAREPAVQTVAREPAVQTVAREPVAAPDNDQQNIAEIAPIAPVETPHPNGAQSRAPKPPPADAQASSRPPTVDEIRNQIHDLEARLEHLIREGKERNGAMPAHPAAAKPPASRPSSSAREMPADDSVTARELLSTDFYLRRWGRMGMKSRSEDVDEFGLDPKYESRLKPFFDFLHQYYFRVDTEGIEHIPNEGRCLIVSNHSGGTLPYDGVMLRTIVRREHPKARELRWLSEDFIYYLPFVGAAMSRLGAVRACQENAERLLSQETLVAVFPEGAKGIGKLYGDRYKLQRFGRGGFIRLCLRTQTPLIPCAIVGAEEANPMLYRIEYMTKSIGIPYIPITPTFPALGPLGLLPAPTKWKVRFGEPIDFEGYGAEAADDELLVGRLSERVRSMIQQMVDRTLGARRSIWFG